MFDPLGRLIVELRADPTVAALTSSIRGGEPAPGDSVTPFQRFVVLVRLGGTREPSVGVQTVIVGMRCYGTTPRDATFLFGACSDALHAVKHRLSGTAGRIYISHVPSVGSADSDPLTKQPLEEGTIEVVASTGAVVV